MTNNTFPAIDNNNKSTIASGDHEYHNNDTYQEEILINTSTSAHISENVYSKNSCNALYVVSQKSISREKTRKINASLKKITA
jgi:hypothetical protein